MLHANKFVARIDEFMHAADLFGESKRFVSYSKFELKLGVIDDSVIQELFLKFVEEVESDGSYIVFAAVKSVDGKDPKERVFKLMPGINTVSVYQYNDLKWGLLSDVLKRLGYKVKTDERMIVESVS